MNFHLKSLSKYDNHDSLIKPIQLASLNGELKSALIYNGILYDKTSSNIDVRPFVAIQTFPSNITPDSSNSSNGGLSMSNLLIISLVIPTSMLLILLFAFCYYKGYFLKSKKPTSNQDIEGAELSTDQIYDIMSYENQMFNPRNNTKLESKSKEDDKNCYSIDEYYLNKNGKINDDIVINFNSDFQTPNKSSNIDDGLGSIESFYEEMMGSNFVNIRKNFSKDSDTGIGNVDNVYNNENHPSISGINPLSPISSIESLSPTKDDDILANISMPGIYGTRSDEEFLCRNPLRVAVDADHVAYI